MSSSAPYTDLDGLEGARGRSDAAARGKRVSAASSRASSRLSGAISGHSTSASVVPAGRRLAVGPCSPCCGTRQRLRVSCGVAVALVAAGAMALVYLVLSSVNQMPDMPPDCTTGCAPPVDTAAWAHLLQTYTRVAPGGSGHAAVANSTEVDYVGLMSAEGTAARTAVREVLAGANVTALNVTCRQALFLNAYNFFAVDMVASHACDGKPCVSINDIGHFWQNVWTIPAGIVGGSSFSLDNIEHGYLRPVFGDPRNHASLNCASISCPPLRRTPYNAGRMEADLDDQARRFVQTTGVESVDVSTKSLTISMIFDWYSADFDPVGGVPKFLAEFGDADVKAAVLGGSPTLSYADYNWDLNIEGA